MFTSEQGEVAQTRAETRAEEWQKPFSAPRVLTLQSVPYMTRLRMIVHVRFFSTQPGRTRFNGTAAAHKKLANANKIKIKRDKSQLYIIIQPIHTTCATLSRLPPAHLPNILHPNTPDTWLKTTAFIEARPGHQARSHRNNFLLEMIASSSSSFSFFWGKKGNKQHSLVFLWVWSVIFILKVLEPREEVWEGEEGKNGKWEKKKKKDDGRMDAQVLLLIDPGAELGWAELSDRLPSGRGERKHNKSQDKSHLTSYFFFFFR